MDRADPSDLTRQRSFSPQPQRQTITRPERAAQTAPRPLGLKFCSNCSLSALGLRYNLSTYFFQYGESMDARILLSKDSSVLRGFTAAASFCLPVLSISSSLTSGSNLNPQ